MVPSTAPVPAVAVTEVELLEAMCRSVPAGFASLAAESASAATFELRVCMALMKVVESVTLFFSRVCGIASACIRLSIRSVVFRPLMSPSMAMPMRFSPSYDSDAGWCVVRVVRRPGRALGTTPRPPGLSAEQLENALVGLVRLSEHRRAGLRQDVGAGVLHHLLRHVGVGDAAGRGREV